MHNACAQNIPKLTTGAFAFCCGSLKKSRRSSLLNPVLSPAAHKSNSNGRPTSEAGNRGASEDTLDAKFEKWSKSLETRLEATLTAVIEKSLAVLTTRVTELEKRLSVLESQPRTETTNLSADVSTSTQQHLLGEFENRRNHAKNVLVYDLQVPDVGDDLRAFNTLANDFQELMPPVSSFRFGTACDGHPKPLKLVFDSEAGAIRVLKRRAAFAARGILVKNDLTLDQRRYLAKLREDLKSRIESGGQNLTIKFVNGTPQIVNISKNV